MSDKFKKAQVVVSKHRNTEIYADEESGIEIEYYTDVKAGEFSVLTDIINRKKGGDPNLSEIAYIVIADWNIVNEENQKIQINVGNIDKYLPAEMVYELVMNKSSIMDFLEKIKPQENSEA
jgi:hypothetical protein